MCPSSDQRGEERCLPFLCLFPASCHKAADSSGCYRGHCAHALRIPACPVYNAPSRLARAGLGAAPEVVRSTPLSPANTSCRGPRWGGVGGALTSGDVISALGVRGSTLWMRLSLLVGVGGGREEGKDCPHCPQGVVATCERTKAELTRPQCSKPPSPGDENMSPEDSDGSENTSC